METRVLHCAIEQITDLRPSLYLEPHSIACVSVLSQYSTSPARFDVDCSNIVSSWVQQDTKLQLEIVWSEETAGKAERLRLTMQSNQLVELASVALASILTYHVVNLGQLDVMNYGGRADYRSLDIPVVLEISGTETISKLAQRHREKIAQALQNPRSLDAYVVVCGFCQEGHRIRFSYHQQEKEIEE
ncbi:MAG: hypothetical protein AAF639_42260 [Chloroflexota bacterium]